MQYFPISPKEILLSIWRNRFLIKTTTIREIQSCYRGSLIGIIWSLINPLFMLTIYTFVFSEIFKARWHSTSSSKIEFSLVLFSGLIIFNFFSECLNKAPQLILTNVNYVKKVVYPLEILPIISLGSVLFHTVINLFVWLVAYYKFFGIPHITIFYFPFVLMPLIIITLGISWILSSLGVFLRDTNQCITLFTTALMFLSPVFYSVDILSPTLRQLIYFNPLTTVIEQTRNILFWGKHPDFAVLGIYWIISLSIAWMGFVWFQRTRKGFSDVL